MTNNYEELINSFENKLQGLIEKHQLLKIRNEELQQNLDRKENELKHANKDLVDLQESYDHLRMARYLNVSPKERKISKQYINKLVREIDKCLALLNE